MQPRERASGDYLPARAVDAGEDDDELLPTVASDPVEATELTAQCESDVCKRLLGELGAVRSLEGVDALDADDQAPEGAALTTGAADLLV